MWCSARVCIDANNPVKCIEHFIEHTKNQLIPKVELIESDVNAQTNYCFFFFFRFRHTKDSNEKCGKLVRERLITLTAD